jgi:hypothetical protein
VGARTLGSHCLHPVNAAGSVRRSSCGTAWEGLVRRAGTDARGEGRAARGRVGWVRRGARVGGGWLARSVGS